ncbi:hypothetical protein GQ42DRAFT_163644 [Ramicandelaber brevisporus]|nr:hypothetical protein GQ42DRAFT_163644 [Ramicandelaber brevisporus]
MTRAPQSIIDLAQGNVTELPSMSSMDDWFVMKFSILRYPHIAKLWYEKYKERGKASLSDDGMFWTNSSLIFSWIVYEIASMDEIRWILMYDSFNLDPLTYCSLDDFPVPKFEVVEHIYKTMSNDLPPAGYSFEDLEYVVSGWCILGGYEISGLNYTLDHFMLAKRNNIDTSKLPAPTMYIDFNQDSNLYRISDEPLENVIYQGRYDEEAGTAFIDSENFRDVDPTPDNAVYLEKWKNLDYISSQCLHYNS